LLDLYHHRSSPFLNPGLDYTGLEKLSRSVNSIATSGVVSRKIATDSPAGHFNRCTPRQLIATQERRQQVLFNHDVGSLRCLFAADQVETSCRFKQQGSYVVWRENALCDKLAYQRLEYESIDFAMP